MQNSLLDPDDREKQNSDTDDSSDDDEHDLGFSENPGIKHLKGFVEPDQDDDVKKNMSREDRKALKLQDQAAGSEFWYRSHMMQEAGKNLSLEDHEASKLQEHAAGGEFGDQSTMMQQEEEVKKYMRNQSERKQSQWFVPNLKTHNTEAGIKYATNKHAYVLKKRLCQISILHEYWKAEMSRWGQTTQGTGDSSDNGSDDDNDSEISQDKNTPGVKLIHKALLRSRAKKIMKRLDLLKSQVEKKVDSYEKIYKKSQDKI